MEILFQLNNVLRSKIPLLIQLNFILLVLLIVFNWEHIREFLKKINKKTWLALTLIFIISLAIRIFISPHQHIMYIDEAWYMEAGKDMLQTGYQAYYPKSIGWPFIIRIVFGLFGVNNWVALYTSTALGALTSISMFLMTYTITRKQEVSLVSAFLISIMPLHIMWSGSAETNVPSLFFITLTIFFSFLYFRKKDNPLLWLALISIAFTSQFRPENHVLIIFFLIGCLIYHQNFIRNLKLNSILPWFLLVLLIVPNMVQAVSFYSSYNAIESDTEGRQIGSNWAISNLVQNTKNIGPEIFGKPFLPWIFSIFIFSGIYFIYKQNKKQTALVLILSILFWLILFTSWLQTLGGRTRVYLNFYPMMIVFASFGIIGLVRLITNLTNTEKSSLIVLFSFLIILVIIITPYIKVAFYYNADAARRLETKIPELAEKDIPQDCVILSIYPTILKSSTNLDVRDLQFFLTDQDYRDGIFNESECILFFEDYFCLDWWTDKFSKKCELFKDSYELEVFKSYEEQYKIYTFYKLVGKK